jgi:predicted nucleic acid-binding protein
LRGQLVIDAQLVATMLPNGINRIYTYNEEDFSRFKEIVVLAPLIPRLENPDGSDHWASN